MSVYTLNADSLGQNVPSLAVAKWGARFNPRLFKNPDPEVLKEYELATAVTDTSTTQISEVQGTSWESDVLKFGEALRRYDQAVMIKMFGKGDNKLVIPKTTSHLDIDVAKSSGEGDDRDLTEMTHVDTVPMTLTASDFKQGEIRISKEIALTSRVDLVALARYAIAQDMAQDVDTALSGTNSAAGVFQDTNISNRVYGGDATAPSGLTTGDIMTPELFADAMDLIEANNFVPFMTFIHPKQLKALRKDPQFINASEYGGREVVMKGEVGQYLGNRIVPTTNVPNYSSSDTDNNETTETWGADGHTAQFIGTNRAGAKVAGCLAWKERPNIGYEYWRSLSSHRVYYDQTFDTALVFKQAVALAKTTDA